MMALIIAPCLHISLPYFILSYFIFGFQDSVSLHCKNWPLHPQCQAKFPPLECPVPTECNALRGSIQKTMQVSRTTQNRALSQCRIQEDHLSSPPTLPSKPLAGQPPLAWCFPPFSFPPHLLPPLPLASLPPPSPPRPPGYRRLSGGGNYCE